MINISLQLFYCCLTGAFFQVRTFQGQRCVQGSLLKGKWENPQLARSSNCWESPKCSRNQLHPTALSKPKQPVLGCSNSEMTPHNPKASPKIGAGSLNSHCTESHHSPKPSDKAKPPPRTFPSCFCLWQSPQVCRRAYSSNKHLESHQENEGLQEGLQCSNIPLQKYLDVVKGKRSLSSKYTDMRKTH